MRIIALIVVFVEGKVSSTPPHMLSEVDTEAENAPGAHPGNTLESSQDHPLLLPTQSVEKLSSTKPVPGAKKVQDR